jgi:hypothetical protein
MITGRRHQAAVWNGLRDSTHSSGVEVRLRVRDGASVIIISVAHPASNTTK